MARNRLALALLAAISLAVLALPAARCEIDADGDGDVLVVGDSLGVGTEPDLETKPATVRLMESEQAVSPPILVDALPGQPAIGALG